MENVFIFLMGVILTSAAIAVTNRYSRKDDAKVPTTIRPSLLKESYQGIPLDPKEDIFTVFDITGAPVGRFNLDPRQNLEDLREMADVFNWPDFGTWSLQQNYGRSITGTFQKEIDTLIFWRKDR